MKKKTMGIVTAASLGILLAASISIGATYSLWSAKTSVQNHLTSGNLALRLERTKLSKCSLDSGTGYLVTSTDAQVKDFTDTTTADSNIFDIGSGELVVPGSYYEATLKLSNIGSVAFDYTVRLALSDADPDALASQLRVYIDGKASDYLHNGSNGGKFDIAAGQMGKEDPAKEFTIKVQFEDLEANNSAMDQKANFDITVDATQATAKKA